MNNFFGRKRNHFVNNKQGDRRGQGQKTCNGRVNHTVAYQAAE